MYQTKSMRTTKQKFKNLLTKHSNGTWDTDRRNSEEEHDHTRQGTGSGSVDNETSDYTTNNSTQIEWSGQISGIGRWTTS